MFMKVYSQKLLLLTCLLLLCSCGKALNIINGEDDDTPPVIEPVKPPVIEPSEFLRNQTLVCGEDAGCE